MRQLERVRKESPSAAIAVHPECTPDVVNAADAAGSTSFLISYVDKAAPGSTIAIGTEINLVERLAETHKGTVTVLPLVESACTHMAQTTETKLRACLEAVEAGRKDYLVNVPEAVKAPAVASLERMLAACAA
jgi:quinolinate synthase